jgi:hypothetical protein
MRHRSRRPFAPAAVAVAVAVTVAGGLVAASPASASSSEYFAAPNGMTGITETITVKAPSQKGNKISLKVVDGFNNSYTFHTTVNSHGYGSLLWTPQFAGPATISGLKSISGLSPLTIQVAGSPSYLVMRAVDTVQAGVSSNAVVDMYVPIGNPYGNGNLIVSTIGVGPGSSVYLGGAPFNGPGQSTAVPWSPPSDLALDIWADFSGMTRTPSGALPSGSDGVTVNVSADPVPVAIRSMATNLEYAMPVNAPTVMDAVLGPNFPDGSVVWSVDGTPISAAMPTSGGVSTLTWTPTVEGAHTLSVAYSAVAADGVTPVTGSASVPFTVGPPTPVDTLTVGPKGQAAWTPGRTFTMDNGAKLTLTATSQSGTTVILSESGPCLIAGSVLRAINTGTCYVTATSPGDQSFTTAKQTYTVRVKNS